MTKTIISKNTKELNSDSIKNVKDVAEHYLDVQKYFKLWNESEEVKNTVSTSKITNILKSICVAIFKEGFEEGVTQSRARESMLPKDFKFTNEVYPESFTIINDLIDYKKDIKDDYDLGHVKHAMTSASMHLDLMGEQNALLHRKINKIKKFIETLETEEKMTEELKEVLKLLEG